MAMTKIRTIGSLVLSLLVIAALLVPEDALAKKKGKRTGKKALVEADPTPQELAREHYSKGKEFYDQGNFEAALVEFNAAYEIKAHPTVLKSVAECQFQMGDLAAAVETFETYLTDPESPDKEDIQARVDEIKITPMDVSISSTPEGASIAIPGADVDTVTPATVKLPPGEHVVTFTMEGYEPLEKPVTVVLGDEGELSVDYATEGRPVAAGALVDPFSEDEAAATEGAEEKSGPPVAFWACAAVTGVGLVMGTVFGTMALDDDKKYEDDPTEETREAGTRNAIIADVSFGVAGAAAIAGIIVFVVDRKKNKRGSQDKASVLVTPVADQNQIGLNAQVSF